MSNLVKMSYKSGCILGDRYKPSEHLHFTFNLQQIALKYESGGISGRWTD